jgi:hypothetical protein
MTKKTIGTIICSGRLANSVSGRRKWFVAREPPESKPGKGGLGHQNRGVDVVRAAKEALKKIGE